MPRIPRFGRSDADPTQPPQTTDPAAAPDLDDSSPTAVMAAVPGLAPADAPASDSPAGPEQPSPPAGAEPPAQGSLGFAERARARRRLRFLRRARELGYRDLGGLVFDLHRFGRERDDLIAAKVHTLAVMDQELRALETLLGEHRAVTVLHEPGIVACPRCAAIHGTETNYCPNCGLPTGGRADMPMAVPGAVAAPEPPTAGAPPAATAAPVAAAPPPSAAPAPLEEPSAPTATSPGEATTESVPPAVPAPDEPAGPAGEEFEAGEIAADAPGRSVWRAPSPVPGSGPASSDDQPLSR